MSILSTSWALADCMSSNSVVQPTEEVEVIDCIDEDNSDLNKHVNYPCTKCNNSFDTQYAFTAHACCKSELNKGLDGFLCPWCEKRFLDLKVLREHVKICWKGMLTCVICSVTICGKLGIIKHLQEHKKKSPESPTRDTACLVCGLFDEKWNVIEHWRAHTGVNLLQCVVCKQNLDIETLPSHLNMHRRNDPGCGDLNWCHSCGLTFRNKAAYLNHRNGHSTRKYSHLCESCGLFFESFDDLEQHMLYHVDQNTVYKCTKCNKIYPFWAHFEIHCKVCFRMGEMNSTTDAAQALLRSIREKYLKVFNTHMLDLIRYAIKKDIKSGRRVPVMQTKVPQVNNSSGNMLMKLRKEDSTVLLYSCQACKMRLVGKESFMRHWREHTGYDPNKCVICSETFAIPKLLEIHMSIAHASCFKCTSCAMVFKTSLERKYHSAAHNGKNSYFCEICGAGFEEFNYLEYHVFTNHVKDCEIRSYQLGTRSGPTANRSTSTQSTANAIVGGPSNVLQLPGSSGATVANFSTTIASGSAVNLQLPGTSNPHINALMKQVTNVPSAFAKVATPVSHAVPTPAATLDVQQQTSKATSPRVNVRDLYMCTVCKVVSPDLPTMVAHARSHKT